MKIGCITISDRASAGIYEDRGGPEIVRVMRRFVSAPVEFQTRIIPDDQAAISAELLKLADEHCCDVILTTGGTGITPRDVTPEATRAVLDKELPGFAEAMRMESFRRVRTAILSRAVAGVRGRTLIVNLPGKPAAIAECLDVLKGAILEAVRHLRGEDPHAIDSRTMAAPK